jgi:hypothetical protein
VNSQLTQRRKRITDYMATGAVRWSIHLIAFWYKLRAMIQCVAISIFGLITAIVLLSFQPFRIVVDDFKPFEAILAPLGATYATILALVFTLSIIPIQRAGEMWSPSIIRLYRRDTATHVSFIVLGIFCIACFTFAVRGLAGIPVSIMFACALATLGISLDLLRWYHGHICQLLDPTHAVRIELQQAKQIVNRTHSRVTRIARLQYQMLDPRSREDISIEDIETTIYPQIAYYPNSINHYINDLGEISVKAVSRGEKLLAKTAVFAIAELTNHYLSARKQNLTIVPSPVALFFASVSDVNVITDRAYEVLYEVSRTAVSQNDESTALRVSEVYQAIADHTANLRARAYRPNSAPLTFAPIYYMMSCVKFAQAKGLDEVPFQSATMLSNIAMGAPNEIAQTDIHMPVIDGLNEIALYSYVKRNFALAEETVGHQFSILAHLLQNKDSHFRDNLRYVLKKIELLVPLAIVNEAIAGRVSIVHPLGKAYALVNTTSLGYLFEQAANTLPHVDADHDWINPYHALINVADIIGRHLRNVAESNEFGESFLIWEIDSLIKHIAIIIARIIDKPLRPDHGDEMALVDKFKWILAFYWVAFTKKKSISKQRADDVGESLVFIGLLYCTRNWYSEVLKLAIVHIRSILESYCEIAESPDYYAIGDMFAHLWAVRMVLVVQKNDAMTATVDEALNTKPPALTDEQWQAAQHAILLRRKQKEKRVLDSDVSAHDGEALAHRLLREAKSDEKTMGSSL